MQAQSHPLSKLLSVYSFGSRIHCVLCTNDSTAWVEHNCPNCAGHQRIKCSLRYIDCVHHGLASSQKPYRFALSWHSHKPLSWSTDSRRAFCSLTVPNRSCLLSTPGYLQAFAQPLHLYVWAPLNRLMKCHSAHIVFSATRMAWHVHLYYLFFHHSTTWVHSLKFTLNYATDYSSRKFMQTHFSPLSTLGPQFVRMRCNLSRSICLSFLPVV